MSECEQS